MDDLPSESVGEISESVARTGELAEMLRSYSSSASDSAYAVPVLKLIVATETGVERSTRRGSICASSRPSRIVPKYPSILPSVKGGLEKL